MNKIYEAELYGDVFSVYVINVKEDIKQSELLLTINNSFSDSTVMIVRCDYKRGNIFDIRMGFENNINCFEDYISIIKSAINEVKKVYCNE